MATTPRASWWFSPATVKCSGAAMWSASNAHSRSLCIPASTRPPPDETWTLPGLPRSSVRARTCRRTCRAQKCATHLSSPTDGWPAFCLPQHSAKRKKALPPGPRITNLVEDLGLENRLRRGIFEDQGRTGTMLCRKREASSYLKAKKSWEHVEEGGGAS